MSNEVETIDLDIPVNLLKDLIIAKFSTTPLDANIVKSFLKEDDLSDLSESPESMQRVITFAGKLTVNAMIVKALTDMANVVIAQAEKNGAIPT